MNDTDIKVGDLIYYRYFINTKSKLLLRFIISETKNEFNTIVLDFETRDRRTGAKFFGRTTMISKKEVYTGYYEVL